MFMTEYDAERQRELDRRDGWEDGRREGRAEVLAELVAGGVVSAADVERFTLAAGPRDAREG